MCEIKIDTALRQAQVSLEWILCWHCSDLGGGQSAGARARVSREHSSKTSSTGRSITLSFIFCPRVTEIALTARLSKNKKWVNINLNTNINIKLYWCKSVTAASAGWQMDNSFLWRLHLICFLRKEKFN